MLVSGEERAGDSEDTLTLEEKLRRERQRNLSVGITQYCWCDTVSAQRCAANRAHVPSHLCTRTPVAEGRPSRLLIPLQGNLYVRHPEKEILELLWDKASTGAAGGALDPKSSPDGQWIGFVQDAEVYAVRTSSYGEEGSAAVQLTSGARGTAGKTNGLADFLAQEEMDRYTGFWWSPDGTKLAFQEADESHIPVYRIMHQGKDVVGASAGAEEDHRYPFVGAQNPRVRLGVIDVREVLAAHANGDGSAAPPIPEPVWMDLGDNEDIYLARVNWLPNGVLTAQVQSRDQRTVRLCAFTASGEATELLREESDTWINLHDMFVALPSPPAGCTTVASGGTAGSPGDVYFLWASERSGFQHLYMYRASFTAGSQPSGVELLRKVTGGEWVVESINSICSRRNTVYVTGSGRGPLEAHVYAVPLWSSEPAFDATTATPVTAFAKGTHAVVFEGSGERFADTHSSLDAPPTVRLYSLNDAHEATELMLVADCGKALAASPGAGGPPGSESTVVPCSDLVPPEQFRLTAADGTTELHGLLYRPDAERFGSGPYPTLCSVYGGPSVQLCRDWWRATADLRAQRFRDMGFAVFKVDNRGSARRGVAFERALHLRMGTVEVEDQVAAVKYLVGRGIADAARVGLYGWSYGGYMTLMGLTKAPDVFRAGVSGAPVTHWDGYDTHYTERYMATPATNAAGFEAGAVMPHVVALTDENKLMLVHGLIDENVHFRHTARVINALIAARKHYDLLLFPEERHSPRRQQDRAYMEHRIAAFFLAHLK